jgi:PilZ domain
VEQGAALALASLPGRTGVQATSQEGATIACDPFQLDGELLRAYVPRLQLGGVQQLTLRFAVGPQPWRAEFELEQAEYHSFEQAIAELRLIEIERDGGGRQSARVTLRAAGVMTAIFCKNAVDGNEYDVIVADVSETGVQFSTEFQVEPRDQFSLATRLDGRRLRVEAEAVQISQGAYGRYTVGAKLTQIAESDVLAIRRLATRPDAG